MLLGLMLFLCVIYPNISHAKLINAPANLLKHSEKTVIPSSHEPVAAPEKKETIQQEQQMREVTAKPQALEPTVRPSTEDASVKVPDISSKIESPTTHEQATQTPPHAAKEEEKYLINAKDLKFTLASSNGDIVDVARLPQGYVVRSATTLTTPQGYILNCEKGTK